MKKILLLICLSFLGSAALHAQSWEKLFSRKSTDVFRSIREVPAGGFVAAGYTSDSTVSDTDGYVVRMNTLGDTLWTFRYNGALSMKDLFYKVVPTADGGFIMCGYTTSVTGISDDILYVKINSSGHQQWAKTWGGAGKDRAQDIIQLGDGSYTIAGYTTSSPAQYYDAILYHVNSTGDSLWMKRYGSATYDDANSVRVLSDGGYIAGGQSSNGANGFDQFLFRTNSIGDTIWTRRFGTAGTDNIEYISIVPNGFILAGSTNGAGVGGDDGYLVRTDTGGVVQWAKTYGGSLPDDFHRVELTSNGGFVASGTTSSTGPNLPNMWLMRTNSSGDSLWSKAYGGENHDHGYSGQQTSDGGYIIAGHSGSFGYYNEEGYVVKSDANGDVSNHLTYTSVTAMTSPTVSVCGGGNVQVKIVIRNFGNETVASVPVVCNITGALTQTINATYASSFSPLDADTLTFPTSISTVGAGTYTFTFATQNNNDVYPANNTFTTTITLDGNTGTPVAADSARCGTGTVTLAANAASTVYWFTAASGGTSVASGSTYTTPSISTTTTYYAQTGLTCPSARVAVTAIVNAAPAIPVTTGGSNCGTGTVMLSATSSNTITWYDASTGGTAVGSGATYTTPSISSTATYYAGASNANCSSARAAAVATINSIPSVPVVTDGSSCGAGTVMLNASAGTTINWYDASSGGTLVATGTSFTTPSLSSTATYYAQANDGNCQSALVPGVANIFAVPVVSVGNDTVIGAGSSYTFDAGPGFSSYLWSTTETTQTITVNASNTYCVTVTNSDNCTATDCAFLDVSIGMDQLSNSEMHIYPNPSSGAFKISFAGNEKNAAVQIINALGKIVRTIELKNIIAGSAEIKGTGDLPPGAYMISILTDAKKTTQPLIIQ